MSVNLMPLQNEIARINREKGWYDEPRSVPELMALIHSEVSEALEAYRENGEVELCYFADNGKPEGIGPELADVVIRVFDLCERLTIDLGHMIDIKMEYNKTRSYRHGGKHL